MSAFARFGCASASLSLKCLRKRTRYALWTGMGLAIAVHLLVTQIRGVGEVRKVAKPLTTQFVKRQPRLTKPLELKKRPQPKRRQVRREMVSVKAKANSKEVTSSVQPVEALGSLARPGAEMTRSVGFSAEVWEPQAAAQVVEGSKESQHMVDMSLEMVDIDALDTGRYQAMVIQDPDDKRNIRGYFHFWMPWGLNYSDEGWHNWPNRVKYAARRVVLKMSEWTGVKADVKGIIGFDSGELLETPWVVLTHWFKMYPTNAELENIFRYMSTGGFVFTEGDPETDDRCSVVRRAFEFGGYRESKDWHWEPLPHSHGLLHCYFDFPSGPPSGHNALCYQLNLRSPGGWPDSRAPDPPEIKAVQVGERIVAITNNAGYISPWGDWGQEAIPSERNSTYGVYDPRRQLEFGVNTIIFALTQEGSITRRLVDTVR